MLFIAVFAILAGCNTSRQIEWISPYKDIDWDNVIQAKAQFHAHTTVSDGWLAPHAVVETYKKIGYQILALTDNWRPVWLTSTDDMHRPYEYHSGFQIQLLNKLDKENVYKSLKDGAFFWVVRQ